MEDNISELTRKGEALCCQNGTLLMERVALIRAGNALARAIGHNQTCPKVSAAIPCVCGAAGEQAKALADWLVLAREYDAA